MSDGTASAQKNPQVVGFVDRMRWHQAVMRDGSLSQGARLIAVVLSHHANDKEDRCDPSHARVGEMVGMDPSNVSKAISALSRAGWIRISTRKGQRNNYHLVPAESREPMALAPTPTLGASATHPRRQRGGTLGASAKGPMAPAPYEPSPYQSQNRDEPEETLNRPQAATAETGNETPPAVVVDEVNPIGGDVDQIRHDALSGEREPPAGEMPDHAEGDHGGAVDGGVDEPFPVDWPDAVDVDHVPFPEEWADDVAPQVVPEIPTAKVRKVITVEDLDANEEGFRRTEKASLQDGVSLFALMEEHADELLAMKKSQRFDALMILKRKAMAANNNERINAEAV